MTTAAWSRNTSQASDSQQRPGETWAEWRRRRAALVIAAGPRDPYEEKALRPVKHDVVLTGIECTQEMGCRCPRCEARNKDTAARVAAEKYLARKWKLSIGAGQDDSNALEEEDPLVRWNGSDQAILPIRSYGQLMAKWRAENDDHPDSIDWQDAPAGCKDTYGLLVNKALDAFGKGATIAQVKLARLAMPQAHLAWLEKGNGAALIASTLDGLITLLGDPVTEAKDSYPGAPEGHWQRLAGKTYNGLLETFVVAIMSAKAGARMSDRRRAWLMNQQETRDAFDLHEYRYVSVSAMADARRKAKKDGLIKQVQSAVHYRDQHRWRVAEPAVWKPLVQVPQEVTQVFVELIRLTSKASAGELRDKLRLAA